MKFSTAVKKFKNKWIVFRFTNRAKDKGIVLLQDKDRHRLHKKLDSRTKRPANIYITFTGPKLPEDYAVILRINC